MNKKISMPLEETLGVGQAKIRSSDHYKVYINSVLETLENSQIGVNIGPINTGVCCVADDLYLLTDCQVKLQCMLNIAAEYGRNYLYKFGAEKTVISVIGSNKDIEYYSQINPWTMGNSPVTVKENNEHLGLIVSNVSEEAKNVDAKLQKARRALFSLLGPVFASKCLLSPVVQTYLFKTFVCPIARSGLCAMTLQNHHLNDIAMFQKKALRGFLHLSQRSPIPALFFLTGEIPIIAKLHRDIYAPCFTVFG